VASKPDWVIEWSVLNLTIIVRYPYVPDTVVLLFAEDDPRSSRIMVLSEQSLVLQEKTWMESQQLSVEYHGKVILTESCHT